MLSTSPPAVVLAEGEGDMLWRVEEGSRKYYRKKDFSMFAYFFFPCYMYMSNIGVFLFSFFFPFYFIYKSLENNFYI